MTINDQIKILDKKILQNEVQYDLDKKAAIISARSSKNLDKAEYLTGEDLGLKPNTIEQARFEYSPLGRIFNKGLSEDEYISDSISSKSKDKDKDEDEKTLREVYQDGIEGMEGHIFPGEIKSKDEKYQIYLKNNLKEIKNNFTNVNDKYPRCFQYIHC